MQSATACLICYCDIVCSCWWLNPVPLVCACVELYPAKYGLDADLPAVPVSPPPTFDVVSSVSVTLNSLFTISSLLTLPSVRG